MKNLLIIFNLLAASLLSCSAKAAITIDSVKTTTSTCANNGSMIIYAQTTTGTLLYAVTSGPSTYPVQTANNFSSLTPGTYTVEVSNTSNETQTTVVTIDGNYQLPDFIPGVVNPYCPDSSSGSVIGNITLSAGISPYTWELVSPSTITRPQQVNDTFYNLSSGNYTIRLTDGCNNVQTKTVALFAGQVPMTFTGGFARIIGCDTTEIGLSVMTPAFRPPYKINYTIAGISYTIDTAKVDDESVFNGYPNIYFTVPNISYGAMVDNVTVTNSCGVQVLVPQLRICPFELVNTNFTPISIANCKNGILTNFGIGATGCNINVYPKFPLRVTIRELPANNMVEVKTYQSPFDYTLASTAMSPGISYNVTMVDSCGNSRTTAITPPVLNRYVSLGMNAQQAMLDSTVVASIAAVGFPTTGTTLTVTGGPVSAHSTKPGYVYNENYVYPKSFTGQTSSDSSTFFSMANAAPGIYTYLIKDSCGNQFPGSFEITKNDVASFFYNYNYQKGCAGSSGLQYEVVQNSFSQVNLTNIATGAVIHTTYGWQMNQNPFTNIVNNITAADYEFSIYYFGRGKDYSMNNTLVDTFFVRDTIHIVPYQNPALKTTAASSCNGQLFLALIADSTKGIPPYQYEIISGPQAFPPQTSNIFQLILAGNYTIRLIDSCGNSVSTDVTVNPLVFPPMAGSGNQCGNDSVLLTYGGSSYFAYTWTKPDGSIYSGDTLVIKRVTTSDTGTYTIQRITTINGCSNTQTTTYRLLAGKRDSATVTICSGQTFKFGNRTLSQPGLYKDTIPTASCDSISILNLVVNTQKRDSSSASICPGQVYSFGNKSLTVAGIYRDTIATASCDSISILNLAVHAQKRDSNSVAICRGQTYSFGKNLLNAPGVYRDTIAIAFCDSISILNLSMYELPAIKLQSDKSIVIAGETVHLSVTPSNLISYLWTSLNALNTSNIYNPASIVNMPSWYSVTVTDANNCSKSDSLFISFKPDTILTCDNTHIIYIPTAFTPNNDSWNDQFRILGINNTAYKSYHLIIYNRWGELVFKSEKPAEGWDGTYKGKRAGVGNYVYLLRFTCSDGQRIFNRKGNIMLLR
ncbi:MAG: gliding motility-associated C-terminal domain-containing protein [Ferruginibacter sp.]